MTCSDAALSILFYSTGHWHVIFMISKKACIVFVYVYLVDANQISQKGMTLMSEK